jgi:hypothetical protein
VAKAKAKAGKKAKKAVRRSAPRKAHASTAAAPAKVERTFPCKALVNKGGEKLAVEVKDAAHYAQLVEQFGETGIEVLS